MQKPSMPLPVSRSYVRWSMALLVAINLVNFIDRFVLAAVEKPIREAFFAPDDQDAKFWTGMLSTMFLLSYMFAAPLFGWLADRSSRWLWVGVGVIVWSVATGGTGLAPTFTLLLITRAFVGIGEAAYNPVAPTMIADLYPVEQRGAKLSLFYVAIPVGSAIGFVLGGFVGGMWGWRAAFGVVVLPGIILGILALLMRDPPRQKGHGSIRTAGDSGRRKYAELWRTPSYVINTAGMTAMTFALGGIAFWMPTYVHEFRQAGSLEDVNMIFGGITVFTGLTATLSGGKLCDVLTKRFPGAYFWVSGVSMLLGFPCFIATLFVPFKPFPWAWGCIFVAEFCLFFSTGPTNAITANVTRPAIRASAFAINIFVIHLLGDVISPPLIGKITGWANGNMNAGFMAVSVAILISGVFWLCGSKFLARDTAQAQSQDDETGQPMP